MRLLRFVDDTLTNGTINVGDDVRVLVGGGFHESDPESYRIEHTCKTVETADGPAIVVCAPCLDKQHTVEHNHGNITIRPSILCPDCGLHGYITEGKWQSV